MNVLTYNGKEFLINGKTAFYFWETFGFPVEIFTEMVNDKIKDPLLKAQLCSQAYKLWISSK